MSEEKMTQVVKRIVTRFLEAGEIEPVLVAPRLAYLITQELREAGLIVRLSAHAEVPPFPAETWRVGDWGEWRISREELAADLEPPPGAGEAGGGSGSQAIPPESEVRL